MQLNKVEPLNDSDLERYKQLRAVIAQGSFELKGNAIAKVASLLNWYDSLEGKMHDAIGKMKAAGAPKIKKMKNVDNAG